MKPLSVSGCTQAQRPRKSKTGVNRSTSTGTALCVPSGLDGIPSKSRALRLVRACAGPGPPPAWPAFCCSGSPDAICAAQLHNMPPNIPSYSKGPPPAVNCWQCRHFATSWDPALPYSCKLLGFKSRMLPCMQVQQLDGQACQGFEPKVAAGSAGVKVSANRQ